MSRKGPRLLWTVAAGVALLALLLAAYGFYSQAVPRDREITVHAHQFSFDPAIIRVNKGDRVTLHLVSEDVAHGLFIDGYDVNLHAAPSEDAGRETTATFVADKTGTFHFRCSVTCGLFHPYMVGKIIVEPDYTFAGAAAAAALMALLSAFYLRRKAVAGASRAP